MDHVDLLNLTPEAQMDLMTMMMNLEKLSEFSDQPPPPPTAGFSSGPNSPPLFYNTTTTTTTAPVLINPPSSYGSGTTTPHDYPILNTPNHIDQLSVFGVEPGRTSSVSAMREMIFRIAAMQPIHIDPESVKPPKRRNVRISKDPQSVAARHRRERISERIRILQRLVPGGTKMDTASMLDEAIHYVKFLKTQVQSLERAAATRSSAAAGGFSGGSYNSYQGLGGQLID